MVSTGSRLDHLECRACCTDLPVDRPVGTCPTCGGALFAAYRLGDFDARSWTRTVSERPPSLWRYRELLPVRDSDVIASLGEGWSPVIDLGRVDGADGITVLLKDDGGEPTGSFKARGMAVAVSRARELGVRAFFVPSAGNAGVALAAYAARAGGTARIYLPEATPGSMTSRCREYGAEVVAVPGTIRDAGESARAREKDSGAFDLSTLREPYRAEGKKTMGFEIWEALRGDGLPDAVVYPAGGGTGIIGISKAFSELAALGLADRCPRLYAVQPDGCAPLVKALDSGEPVARPWTGPATIAPGLLVPAPFASERILEAIRSSRGGGATVSDRDIARAARALAARHGVSASPEGAAPYAALPGLVASGAIRAGERVLLYNTGSGLPFSLDGLDRAAGGR